MLRRALYGFGLLLILFFTTVWAQVEVPTLSRHVTDLTGTLNTDQINDIENSLTEFEAEKSSQIAVLIIPTTQPEDIAQFGIRVADAWRIGRKNIDDGVILIIAKDDRKMRLEVGYGLEGAIPDAVAKRVLDETIAPYFKKGEFAAGIKAGITSVMRLIEGESLPGSQTAATHEQTSNHFMFVLFCGAIAGFVLSIFVGRIMGGLLASLVSATVAILLLGLSFGVAVFIAVIIFFMVGVRQSIGRGWTGGGFGGGSGGSWGGGGGSFGGGGASGSW